MGFWGKIHSLQFLSNESRGLEFGDISGELVKDAHWQLYAAKQQRGTYLWLVGSDAKGRINALEGLACITTCLTSTPDGDDSAHLSPSGRFVEAQ